MSVMGGPALRSGPYHGPDEAEECARDAERAGDEDGAMEAELVLERDSERDPECHAEGTRRRGHRPGDALPLTRSGPHDEGAVGRDVETGADTDERQRDDERASWQLSRRGGADHTD